MRTEYEVYFKFADNGTFTKVDQRFPTLPEAREHTTFVDPDDWQQTPLHGHLILAQRHLDQMGRSSPWLIREVEVPGTGDEPALPDHLTPTTTDRGFDHLPPIPSEYGGEVRVYESSAASGPHIWLNATAPVSLNDPTGPTREAPIHLTAENAWRLADQLRFLVEHHYQGDARPTEG